MGVVHAQAWQMVSPGDRGELENGPGAWLAAEGEAYP